MMRERSILATTALTLALIAAVCAAIFAASYVADQLHAGVPVDLLRIFEAMDDAAAQNTLGSMGEVIAAVLGVAITVVSIVLQLAANRYTPKVTDLFFRSPVNLGVMSLFVVGAFQAIWVGFSVRHDFVPKTGVAVAVFFLSASLIVMIPYFTYVFHFLRPDSIIRRIGTEIGDRVRSLADRDPVSRAHAGGALVSGIEQLSEIGLNAIGNRDKTIAVRAIETLREIATGHSETKSGAVLPPDEGRRIFLSDPDLVSMPTEVIDGLIRRNVWLEMKVLRQFQMLFNNSLGRMVDVDHYLAMQTREIGAKAIERGDPALVNLVVRFFNTYMRASINATSVRTAYNVLHQYREFAERVVDSGDQERVAEIVGYLKYYGLLSLNRGLPFLLETAAYDICALMQRIREAELPNERRLLELFLTVDREYEGEEQPFEESLRGVRKAQVKLAVHYLSASREDLARIVFDDMANESRVRLSSIKQEMTSVTEKYFWEIVDRGVNLDYIPPHQRRHLETFFGWFDDLPPPPRASRLMHA
jgi:hypothetical protein